VRTGYPPEDVLSDADLAAAKWSWQNNTPAGRGADTLPGAKRLFLPMRTGRGAVGVVGLDRDRPGPLLAPDQRRLLDALKFLPQRHQSRAAETVSAFMDGTAATKTQASVLKLSLYSALEWALIVLCFACIFRSCPETSAFTLQDVLIFVGFVAFGSILQIPGVGGGVQLVSLVVLTQLYRTSLEVATSLAIMIWFITFVGIVPLGLLCAFQEGFNWRRIREIEKCALRAEPPPESGPTEPAP
jgi:hypothetical protein